MIETSVSIGFATRALAMVTLLTLIPTGGVRSGPQDGFIPPEGLEEGWYARIETDKGLILARLLPDQAPQTVAHFAGLANGTLPWSDPLTGETRQGHFYDGITVDLSKAGERFEAGGLSGDPDRKPPVMFVPPTEGQSPINFHHAGRLGMTRLQMGRVSAVKFFVTVASLPHLNYSHPCFGQVIEGKEVAFTISQVRTYSNGRPIEPIEIQLVRVFPIGDPEPLVEPQGYFPRPTKPEARTKN